jgi:hypothetical protein
MKGTREDLPERSSGLPAGGGEHEIRRIKTASLKIRRPSGLGGSTPPPGTNLKSRFGRGLQHIAHSENLNRNKPRIWACDAIVTGKRRRQANSNAQSNVLGGWGSPRV